MDEKGMCVRPLVLVHVADRAEALRRIVQALRPGGRLLLEDADPASQPLLSPDESGQEQRLANPLRSGFRTLMATHGADPACAAAHRAKVRGGRPTTFSTADVTLTHRPFQFPSLAGRQDRQPSRTRRSGHCRDLRPRTQRDVVTSTAMPLHAVRPLRPE